MYIQSGYTCLWCTKKELKLKQPVMENSGPAVFDYVKE